MNNCNVILKKFDPWKLNMKTKAPNIKYLIKIHKINNPIRSIAIITGEKHQLTSIKTFNRHDQSIWVCICYR
jgi:hypothetical protein